MTMREEFEAWHKSLPPANYDAFHAWCAAYRAGQEDMRERAAKHLIDLAQDADMEWSLAAKDCADHIRALPVDAD